MIRRNQNIYDELEEKFEVLRLRTFKCIELKVMELFEEQKIKYEIQKKITEKQVEDDFVKDELA